MTYAPGLTPGPQLTPADAAPALNGTPAPSPSPHSDPLIGGSGFGRSDAYDAARAGAGVNTAGDGTAGDRAQPGPGRQSPAPPAPAPAAAAAPSEMDYLRPSCSHAVESAEEILQVGGGGPGVGEGREWVGVSRGGKG